jgi:hypothetical protein
MIGSLLFSNLSNEADVRTTATRNSIRRVADPTTDRLFA